MQSSNRFLDIESVSYTHLDEIYPTLSANGNTAVFTAEDNLSVNADPEKLARVFSNLLRNAASYSYPQTEITIFAKRLEHDIQITDVYKRQLSGYHLRRTLRPLDLRPYDGSKDACHTPTLQDVHRLTKG